MRNEINRPTISQLLLEINGHIIMPFLSHHQDNSLNSIWIAFDNLADTVNLHLVDFEVAENDDRAALVLALIVTDFVFLEIFSCEVEAIFGMQ